MSQWPARLETADTIYTPWTDGYAVGFRCERKTDGAVGYIYLNPSNNEDGGPDDTPCVFVYAGIHGDPSADGAQCYISADGDHAYES